MIGGFGGEAGGGDAGLVKGRPEAVSLGGGIGMVGDVEEEKRRDAAVGGDVVDGGELALVGEVAELFGVAHTRRGLLEAEAASGGRGDLEGDVVGVAVDRDAAADDVAGDTFGFEVAGVGAKERGELAAGGVAHEEDAGGVAAMLGDVGVDPADGASGVADNVVHGDVGDESIVNRDKEHALFGESGGFVADLLFAAAHPAAAVDPDDNRVAGAGGWGENVEELTLVPGLSVGDVALGVEGKEGDEEEQEPREHMGYVTGNPGQDLHWKK